MNYLEVVEVVSSIQVYAFGFLIDGHDSQADILRAMEFPSLDLKHNHRTTFKLFFDDIFSTFKQSCYDDTGIDRTQYGCWHYCSL